MCEIGCAPTAPRACSLSRCNACATRAALPLHELWRLVQLVLAVPFLLENPVGYIARSFNLGRQFFFVWTVNWRLISEDLFLNRTFHAALLAVHILLLAVLAAKLLRLDKLCCVCCVCVLCVCCVCVVCVLCVLCVCCVCVCVVCVCVCCVCVLCVCVCASIMWEPIMPFFSHHAHACIATPLIFA